MRELTVSCSRSRFSLFFFPFLFLREIIERSVVFFGKKSAAKKFRVSTKRPRAGWSAVDFANRNTGQRVSRTEIMPRSFLASSFRARVENSGPARSAKCPNCKAVPLLSPFFNLARFCDARSHVLREYTLCVCSKTDQESFKAFMNIVTCIVNTLFLLFVLLFLLIVLFYKYIL